MVEFKKILGFENGMSRTALVVTIFGYVVWFGTWSHPTLLEYVALVLSFLILHPLAIFLMRWIDERRHPIHRTLRLAFNDSLERTKLASVSKDILLQIMAGWVTMRARTILLGYVLRDLPFVIYTAAIIVPRLDHPGSGYLIGMSQQIFFICISGFFVLIEQGPKFQRLRAFIAVELALPEVSRLGLPRYLQPNIQDVETALKACLLFFTLGLPLLLTSQTPGTATGCDLLIPWMSICSTVVFFFMFSLKRREYKRQGKMLMDYKFEVKKGIRIDTEINRMSRLGLMTGSVIHDLAGPITTLKLLLENTRNRLDVHDVHDVDFLALTVVCNQIDALLASLRATLQNPKAHPVGQARFGDSVNYAVTLLQIAERVSSPLKWQSLVSFEAREVVVALPQMDLVQILINLGGNSLRAMRGINDAKLSIEIHSRDDKFCIFSFSDNGSGLTQERFQALTAVSELGDNDSNVREGLGLRLTCRMVERVGGSIILDSGSGLTGANPGTIMYVKLPLA